MFVLKFYDNQRGLFDEVPLEENEVTIGRSLDNRVVLPIPAVSRKHATFWLEKKDGAIVARLRDENSSNGCYVNGKLVRGDTVTIEAGDRVQIYSFWIEVYKAATFDLAGGSDMEDATIVFQSKPSLDTALPNERLKMLYRFASEAASCDSEGSILAAADTVAGCMEFNVFCILLQRNGYLEFVTSYDANGACSPNQVQVSHSVIKKCFKERVAILADGGGAVDGLEETSVIGSLNSVVCVPLLSGTENFGVLYCSAVSREVVYDVEELQFLNLVASMLASDLGMKKTISQLDAEKKKSEAILGNLKEGVIVTDESFQVISANPAAQAIFGKEELNGCNFRELLSGFNHSLDLEMLASVREFRIERREDDAWNGQSPKKDTDGQSGAGLIRTFAATLSAHEGKLPVAWKYVISLKDISEVHRIERIKTLLVNRLAHKILNPLTVISSAASLAAQFDGMDNEVESLIQKCVESSENCMNLVRQIQDYTSLRLDAELQGASFMECRLENLVDGARIRIIGMPGADTFKIENTFEDGVIVIKGDFNKLQLAFEHIIQNAVKFGNDEGSLSISARLINERMAEIGFLDDGPGIPETEIKYLGTLLHQVDSENTGEVEGVGLGLWVVHEVVNAHGGEVEIVSPARDDGTGTLVKVTLPVAHLIPEEKPVGSRDKTMYLTRDGKRKKKVFSTDAV